MPILKFWFRDNQISLEKLRLVDITEDKRTSFIDKSALSAEEFKIAENVYIAVNDLFFKFSKFFDKSTTPISAMLLRDENRNILIIPSRSYVFWDGKSVEPNEYKIIQNEGILRQLLRVA